MKIVLDTNVYISAVLFGGICEEILETLFHKEGVIFISPFILSEITMVLKKKFDWQAEQINLVLGDLKERTVLIKPGLGAKAIKQKTDDNKILDCALAAQADFLVSGDKRHILPLKSVKGIKIISPREFLRIIHGQNL